MAQQQRKIQKHPHACTTLIDGDLVVMSSQDNIYYRINASGIHIWNFLESNECSLNQLVDFIAHYYQVERNQVHDDVELFITLMLEKGFLQYVEQRDELVPQPDQFQPS